ncbi:MAG: hypothetical protein HOP11_08935 [Saprospiraceae bacterium]|nr:hypothetical protein [Saprospiraceae bacterium]
MVNKVISGLLTMYCLFAINIAALTQSSRPASKKQNIDVQIIDYVEIIQIKPNNKLSKPKRLSKPQIQNFSKNWNSNTPIIKCPANYNYRVSVYYKDLTKKEYFLINSIISDSKLYCYDTGNSGLSDLIWKNK